ncbi:GntR family transcriptional regulator [Phytoactinopolyspora limicola]|uniref:GntR family transcriptional regulator n=1 Tax=Phytoactinopolyspora limicola TaxID=2715536 RepID=UPI00140D6D0D|nr:GntR family transcriptional regulator [Phytoactinopolyspora limicola]
MDMTGAGGLDPSSGVPLYMQVERDLQRRVDVGEWKAGEQLPAEEQLCEVYNVSRVTMRQALARMADRGVVVRERGRGTFVRDQSLTAGARGVTSFTAEMAEIGVTAGSRVVSARTTTAAAAAVPDDAGFAADEPVVELRRLRTGGGRPVGVQTSVLPLGRFPGLDAIDLGSGSLYGLLRSRYGVTPLEAVETFTVGGVLAEDAELLQVKVGTHAFYVERITSDTRGPFEFCHSVMRGDRYRLRLGLRNP